MQVGRLEGLGLELEDRPAEDLPPTAVAQGEVEGAFGRAHGDGRDRHPRGGEDGEHLAQAAAALPEPVVAGDGHGVELEAGEVRRRPGGLRQRTPPDPRGAQVDEEHRASAVAGGVGVRDRGHDGEIGERPVGHVGFGAAQAETGPVGRRGRADRRGVAPGVRLGVRQAEDDPAGGGPRPVAFLERGRPETPQPHQPELRVGESGDRRPRRDPRELLEEQGLAQRPLAPQLPALHGKAVNARLAERGEKRPLERPPRK